MISLFINKPEDLVTEALDGLLRGAGDRLARLDGYPHIKAVVRSDWDTTKTDKVALVSGGGSGHEPAHAGFVGRGLLTAAVCGEVFASPSVDAVLAGILAVTGAAGCLLIVKNYTGDRLNFGLAAERARALGLKVEMVVVDDDVALPDDVQARGLAGTLFVHKVAGALAEDGADLDQVTASARDVVARTASIGMSLDTCRVPGSPKESRIEAGSAELGLGIHGEPGAETLDFESARAAVATMLDRLSPHLASGTPHAVLVNNLGGCTPLEMAVVAEEIARHPVAESLKLMIGPAPMMTSLDMPGISISTLVLTGAMKSALAAPVEPVAWPGLRSLTKPRILPLPDGLAMTQHAPSEDPAVRAFITRCCAVLESHQNTLNALDAKTGDGDTGSTLAGGARAIKSALDRLPLADRANLLSAIADELARAMGGSSGVLLAILFAAAADHAATGAPLADALAAGLDRIQQVGGAEPGDRTMIDALAPALTVLQQGGTLSAAAQAARAGANATAAMPRARAGRAAYVAAENLAGVPDPGAEAVALLFEGIVG